MSYNFFTQSNQELSRPVVARRGFEVVSCDVPDFSGMPIPMSVPMSLRTIPAPGVSTVVQNTSTTTITTSTPSPAAVFNPRPTTSTASPSFIGQSRVANVPFFPGVSFSQSGQDHEAEPLTRVQNVPFFPGVSLSQSSQGREARSTSRVSNVPHFPGVYIPEPIPNNNFGGYLNINAGAAPTQNSARSTVPSARSGPPSTPAASNPVFTNTGNIVSTSQNNILGMNLDGSRVRDSVMVQEGENSIPTGRLSFDEIISKVYLLLIDMAKLERSVDNFPAIKSIGQQAEVDQIIREFNMKKMMVISCLQDQGDSRSIIETGILRRVQLDAPNYFSLSDAQKVIVDRVRSLLQLSVEEVIRINHNKLSDDVCELTCEIVLIRIGQISNPRDINLIELELVSKLLQLHSLKATRESMDGYIFQKICNIVNGAIMSMSNPTPMLIKLFVEDKTSKKVLFDNALNNIFSKFFN